MGGWAGWKSAPVRSLIAQLVKTRQGAGKKKKKTGTPVVGGWVRVRNKDQGQTFFGIFFIVFLNSPHRETPRNVIKQIREKVGFWIFGRIFCKNLSTRLFFVKRFL
jgi:hypothetical protein